MNNDKLNILSGGCLCGGVAIKLRDPVGILSTVTVSIVAVPTAILRPILRCSDLTWCLKTKIPCSGTMTNRQIPIAGSASVVVQACFGMPATAATSCPCRQARSTTVAISKQSGTFTWPRRPSTIKSMMDYPALKTVTAVRSNPMGAVDLCTGIG